MCGISGIVYKGSPAEGKASIERMTSSQKHRGPDGEGFFQDESTFLGHNRLSIIDLSPRGSQPMTSANQRWVIVFNGEIYNYKEIRQQLPDYPFQSESDSEVLLAAWEKWGIDCLPKMIGIFAFAIYDKIEKKLFLARDRFGVKPLYYTLRRGHFAFASEIRTLLQSGLSDSQLNENALQEFLSYQSVSPPQTLVDGIFMIGPGEYVTWGNGVAGNGTWWNLTREVHSEMQKYSYKDITEQVLLLCRKAVERRMVADVPVAAFLSGGIDSSAVVALMSQISNKPVETFSVTFSEKEFDESGFAKLIGQKFNTRHHTLLLKPAEILSLLPDALHAMDHPSGDGINTWVVSKMTHEAGIKVALSGIGGDEIFAGYPFFTRIRKINKNPLLRYTPGLLKKMLAGLVNVIPGGRKGEKIAELLRLKSYDLKHLFPAYRILYSRDQIKELAKNAIGPPAIYHWLEKENNNLSKLSLLSQLSVAEITHYLHNVLLRDTDQMGMSQGLEVREPFLDHELISFVLGVPDKFKIGNTPKKLLVDSLGDLLPSEIVNRKKMGFTFPWKRWLKNELSGFASQKLLRLDQRSVFKVGSVKQVWENFNRGDKRILWNHVWLLVVLEEWMEQNNIKG